MPRPLTPLYNEEIRRGRISPVPRLRPSYAAGGLTDQRDTAAGTAVTYPWQVGVTEWYEDFQGITPGARVDTSADWVETQTSVNHW